MSDAQAAAVKLHLNNLTASVFAKVRESVVCNPPVLDVAAEPDDPSLAVAIEDVAKVIRAKMAEVKKLREEVPATLEARFKEAAAAAEASTEAVEDGAAGARRADARPAEESKDGSGRGGSGGAMDDGEAEDEGDGDGGEGSRLGVSAEQLSRLLAMRTQVDRTARELLDVLPRYTGAAQQTAAELRKHR